MNSEFVRISKSFKWEMAHRLPYHQAGCQNLHGHSYRMDVAIEGNPLSNGMVMDYGDLKRIIQPMVEELDHAFMCSSDDELMTDFLKSKSFKVVYVDFHSTAENIALDFLQKIKTRLASCANLVSLHVRVAETLNTYAEVTTDLRS